MLAKFQIIPSIHIHEDKWNACVAKFNMDVYNDYQFLNAVCLDNWYGMVWGDYEKILPFYRKKKWGIFPYVCMPPFCQKFDNRPLEASQWEEALRYMKRHHVRIDYAVTNNLGTNVFEVKTNYILNKKGQSFQVIQERYASLLKKNLAKAHNQLSVCQNDGQAAAIDVLKSIPVFRSLVMKKFSTNFRNLSRRHLQSYYAIDRKSEKILAVLMFVSYRKVAYLLFPYSTDEGRKLQAMSLLIDKLVAQEDIEAVDFEGSSIESIAHFYEQFGAAKHSYWVLHWSSPFILF